MVPPASTDGSLKGSNCEGGQQGTGGESQRVPPKRDLHALRLGNWGLQAVSLGWEGQQGTPLGTLVVGLSPSFPSFCAPLEGSPAPAPAPAGLLVLLCRDTSMNASTCLIRK